MSSKVKMGWRKSLKLYSTRTTMESEAELLDAEAEVQRMGADRTRLAESLDSAEERAMRLENTNREVSRRLVEAMESIRTVLDKKQEGMDAQ